MKVKVRKRLSYEELRNDRNYWMLRYFEERYAHIKRELATNNMGEDFMNNMASDVTPVPWDLYNSHDCCACVQPFDPSEHINEVRGRLFGNCCKEEDK